MSITQTQNTQITFHQKPTDELNIIIGPYAKKLKQSLDFDPELDRTSQEFAEECDINTIMARYQKTGLIDFVNQHQPQYGDATGLEYLEMQNQIVAAKNMFADLPAKIRDRFANDPAKFLDFFNDPENREEAAKMGLLAPETPAPVPTPTPEPVKAPKASKEAPPKDD